MSDSECASGGCETAKSGSVSGKSFCDCGDNAFGSSDDEYCRTEFQSKYPNLNEADWKCIGGTAESGDLDYCQNGAAAEYPAGLQSTGTPGILDTLGKTIESAPLTENELSSMLSKPEPRIEIPGLKFSEIDLQKNKVTDSNGTTYLLFPFLGEYLAAIYKYAIVVISIVSVVMLIAAGFQWIVPDSSGENINSAKSRIAGAFSGLIIAVGSYTILYAINPELVQFRSLRVQYIPGIDGFDEIQSMDIGNTTVATDYESADAGVFGSQTCPFSSAEDMVKNLGSQLTATTKSARIVEAAKIAHGCKVLYGSCSNDASLIYAAAGIGNQSCLQNGMQSGKKCNGNYSDRNATTVIYNAFPSEKIKHTLPTYLCGRYCPKNLNDAWDLNGYYEDKNSPPGCSANPEEAKARVKEMLQAGDKWNEDALSLLQPGDYISTYNANPSCAGMHSTIFLGWKEVGTIAYIVDGDIKRPVSVSTRNLSKSILTGIKRPK